MLKTKPLSQAKSYTYDKASRLTNATLSTNTYGYSYATPSGATCNQSSANLNANKSSNRTSQTVNGVTSTYCYDNADRLIASSDASLTTPTYDTHGNTQTIGQSANTKYLDFDYDSSDRTTKMHQLFGGGTNAYIMQYEYDANDRMISRFEDNGPPPSIWESFYGYTTPGTTSPDYEMDNAWVVRERYIQLIGGALFTVRSSASSFSSTSNVYTLPNVHGDTMLTTKGSGAITNTFTYEPFGKITSTALPDNSNGKADYAYVGKHQKQTETLLGNQPQIMGARVYMSIMGRFMQVDPIEGGNANNYIYPGDPMNDMDLDGLAQRGKQQGNGPRLSDREQQLWNRYGKNGPNRASRDYRDWSRAKQKVKTQEKFNKERRSRESKDDKNNRGGGPPSGGAAAGAGGALFIIWWAGKALSPACGPAIFVCAVAL